MTVICLTLSQELKDELKSEAKDTGLSLNAYIRFILSNRNKNEK